MRLVISFAALFLSVFLVQLGSGSLGPLDALSGSVFGWSAGEIGLLGSAHFAGFFVGCWAMPRLIGHVGHSRAFAAAAALGAIGVLLHPLIEGAAAWACLRVLSGISIAGAYTAVESWLQAKIETRTRGRVFGIYRVVDLTGAICAQSLIAVLEPAAYASYNIVAIFCCLSLVPLALTRAVPPVVDHPPTLRPHCRLEGLAARLLRHRHRRGDGVQLPHGRAGLRAGIRDEPGRDRRLPDRLGDRRRAGAVPRRLAGRQHGAAGMSWSGSRWRRSSRRW